MEKLQPFFRRRPSKSRLILFLVAEGYSVPDLLRMSVKELSSLDLPEEISHYRDETLLFIKDTSEGAPAFQFKNGRPMLYGDFHRVISMATRYVLDKPLSQVAFQEHVSSQEDS
ncbi:hypothetical protein [Alkalilimnicola ehrlichii]|nr:hypothetical protein [Alkalilimnicola ehrlichii]